MPVYLATSSWTTLVTEFISILVAGLESMAEGIGSGLNAFVTNIFFVTNDGVRSFSDFAGVLALFGAIGIAVGIGRFILGWLSSLGARN